ncbi:MAG: phospholipase D-like domain-containing protein [Anaerolineales bacterium]
MRRAAFFVFLIIILGVLALPTPIATAQQDPSCDASAYIDAMLEDVADVQTAVGAARNSAVQAAESYMRVADIRQQYEDAPQVPVCARVLHSYITQWITAGQEQVGMFLAIYADPANQAVYEARLREINQRLGDLATAATNEIGRLEAAQAEEVARADEPPSSADWYRLYFTDPINSQNEADHQGAFIEEALIFAIDNTASTIDAALYELNAPQTTAALVRALNRGVTVRLMVDDEAAFEDPDSTVRELINAGAQVRSDERSALMHHKFFIFDRINIWMGSMNITRNGIYNNNNHAMYMRSPQLAANFQNEFNEMFLDESFTRRGDTRPVPNREVTINGTRVETYFSPEDGRVIETRLISLMGEADQNIRIMAFSFTLDDVGDAIIARLNDGISVQGVFEVRGSLQGQMLPLACAGADMRQDGNPNTMHHKVFIIDDEIVVLGSFNFSASARDRNNENMLVIYDEAIAARFLDEFAQVYQNGRDIPADDFRCPG